MKPDSIGILSGVDCDSRAYVGGETVIGYMALESVRSADFTLLFRGNSIRSTLGPLLRIIAFQAGICIC